MSSIVYADYYINIDCIGINIDDIIDGSINILNKCTDTNYKPIKIAKCTGAFDIIASNMGAICPNCGIFLKNLTTLAIHTKRCGDIDDTDNIEDE